VGAAGMARAGRFSAGGVVASGVWGRSACMLGTDAKAGSGFISGRSGFRSDARSKTGRSGAGALSGAGAGALNAGVTEGDGMAAQSPRSAAPGASCCAGYVSRTTPPARG
jgi:hypothetical protein